MTKEIIGDVCAFIRGINGEKNRHLRIGIAMKDGDRLSFKLDTLPIDKNWEGWINIFPRDANTRELSPNNPRPKSKEQPSDFYDDDVPF